MAEKVICQGVVWEQSHSSFVGNTGGVAPLPIAVGGYLNVVTDAYDDRIPAPIIGGFNYTFSGAGYIYVKLTNTGNYITSTSGEIDSGHYEKIGEKYFKLELYNSNDVLVSSVGMAPVSPSSIESGINYSPAIIEVPDSGNYYLKLKIGLSGEYRFYDMERGGNKITGQQMIFNWELYTKAIEYVEDNENVEENIPVVFPKTIYEGYVWDCYTHISDVYSSGYVNAYPVTDDGYLKIGDESGEFESMIASRGDKYYLWSYNDDGATKGVVTRKRNPLKMEISDIVGEYIIDDGGVGINRYLGLQNIEDNVNKHNWVGILSDRSNGYDTLIIQWRTIDNNSGVDTLTFVDELDDIFFVDETVTHNVVWDNRVCKSVSFTGSGTAVNPFYDSQSDYYLQIGTDSDKYVYFNLLHSGIVTIKLECKNAKLDYSGSTATHTVSDNILNNVAKLRVEIYDKLGHFVERKQITPRCYTTANTNSSKEEYNTVSFNLPRGQYSFAIDILGAYYGPFGYKGSDSESAELLTYWDLTYDIYEVVSDDIDTSTSLNEYCYNFSNSGYIDITITNNGNYLMDGEEIANGSISTPITSTIQLYNNMGVLVSSTHVYPPSPSAIIRGETEKTVTIVIPSAGTYYIKYMMNIFYYNMTKGEDAILQVKDCQLKSYWSIYVDAVEYVEDNENVLDWKKIITCSELNEMWRKCFHEAMLDNHPALDNRWLAQAKEVFYQHVGPTIGYDPMGGGLCVTFGGDNHFSDYAFDDELNYIWSHYLETSEPKSILNPNRNKNLMNPLANDTQSTNKLVSEEELEFYPYDYYTILNNINIYDNLTVVDGSTHVFNSSDIWVSWQIAGITAFESSPYTSSNTFCCTCNIGIDEDISSRPVYLTVTFKNTKNVEYIKSVHVNTCFSKNEKFSDRDFNPTSISANGSSQGTVDATVQATFVGKFKSLREILTSQLHFNFYATWESISKYENIAINQNWHIEGEGMTIYPTFGQTDGFAISSSQTYYRKLYLFDVLYTEGVEIDDFVVPSLATQQSQGINSELKVNTEQLENAIIDLGYSVFSGRTYYLKVPYYVMSHIEDNGTDVINWCYIIIEVVYDPDLPQGSRWKVYNNSEAYIDVGTTDVSTGGGLYIHNDMGSNFLEENWTFGASYFGYGDMPTDYIGLLNHPANINLPHKTYITVEGNSNAMDMEIKCQFLGRNNTTKVYSFWYDSDMGGETDGDFNFIASRNLLSVVQSFNTTNGNEYFTISC